MIETRRLSFCFLWRGGGVTERDAAGQGGALGLPPCGTVALHHAVVQQVSRAGVGEGGALELHRVHLVNETDRDGRKKGRKV